MYKTLNVLVLFFLLVVSCKEKTGSGKEPTKQGNKAVETKNDIRAVILFVLGKVTLGDTKLKSGDIIDINGNIQTDKNSFCDLQVKMKDTNIVVRLKANSNFSLQSLQALDTVKYKVLLNKGSALFNISALKQNEQFNVFTPVSVVAVRGTQFLVTVKEDSTSQVKVVEGKVANKIHIPEVELLKETVLKEGDAAENIFKSITETETVIGKDEEVDVSKKEMDAIIASAQLEEIRKDLTVKDSVDNFQEENREKLRKALEAYQAKLKAQTNSDHQKVAGLTDTTLQPTKYNSKPLKGEFDELEGLSQEAISSDDTVVKTEVDKLLQKKKATIMKTIEKTFGKRSETLILKGGRRVRGVIFQHHSNYHIITPDGEMVLPESAVEGFAF
jgi:hypothetical protein